MRVRVRISEKQRGNTLERFVKLSKGVVIAIDSA